MFREPLFKIISINADDTSVVASVAIDINNEILKGHFPGQPVVPGASMLQLVKEVLATAVNKPLRLLKAENIKFLSLVDPSLQTLQINIPYRLTGSEIKVNVTLHAGEITCMKLQATFVSL